MLMGIDIAVNIKIVNKADKENIFLLVGQYIKVVFMKINLTDKER